MILIRVLYMYSILRWCCACKVCTWELVTVLGIHRNTKQMQLKLQAACICKLARFGKVRQGLKAYAVLTGELT